MRWGRGTVATRAVADDRDEGGGTVAVLPDERGKSVAVVPDERGKSVAVLPDEVSFALPGCMVTILVYFAK